MFKVNKDSRMMTLTRRSGIVIVNFEYFSRLLLVFLFLALLTLNI